MAAEQIEQENLLRISGIMRESIVDGPGIRYVVFTQGCPHRCEGCHNPQTHDFEGGSFINIKTIAEDINNDSLLAGVTFSGGEPLCQAAPLAGLAGIVKDIGLDLMIYSGYYYEEILDMAETDADIRRLIELADKLVDGRFVLAERDLTLPFRGSRNQRFIDLAESRRTGVCMEYQSHKWDIL